MVVADVLGLDSAPPRRVMLDPRDPLLAFSISLKASICYELGTLLRLNAINDLNAGQRNMENRFFEIHSGEHQVDLPSMPGAPTI